MIVFEKPLLNFLVFKFQEEPLARFAFNLGVEDVRLLSGEELSHKKVKVWTPL